MKNENIEDFYPLSPMQQGMLFHTLQMPESGLYLDQTCCVLRGSLNLSAFERAWQQVIDRHPVLRTAFIWNGLKEPVQVVHRSARLTLEQSDWSELSAERREEQLQAAILANQQRGLDLARPPLMRLALMRTGEDTHQFLWVRYHMMMDGWSVPMLLKEVFALYEGFCKGEELHLERSRPYRDYIVWLKQQDMAKAEEFWRRTLKGFSAATPLGVAAKLSTAPHGELSYANQQIKLSVETSSALRSLAMKHELTLNTVVQGAWALLLNRYSGEEDLVFGATVSGRPTELAGVESMLGLFINTLPVRVQVKPHASLIPWLKEIQSHQSEARQYEFSALVQVQGWSDVPRGSQLFQSLLVFENYPLDEGLKQQNMSLEFSDFRVFERTNYPLTLDIGPGQQMLFRMLYDGNRFDEATVIRMLGHLETLLEGIVSDETQSLESLPILTASERTLLKDWNDTAASIPELCAHELFEMQVRRTPAAVAVESEGGRLTYGELNGRANQLARHLRSLGIGPEVFVGIYMERSADMVVAILATLKAGGAYVPLDASTPFERLAYILDDTLAPVLLTQESLVDDLPVTSAQVVCVDAEWGEIEGEDSGDLEGQARPDNLAYMIYTSGSSGRPKAVMIVHSGLVNYLCWAVKAYEVEGGEGSPVHSPLGFDLTVTSLWTPLVAGGCVELLSERDSIGILVKRMKEGRGYSLVKLTPAHMEVLGREMNREEAGTASRVLVIGGEALKAETLKLWRGTGTRLINEYGPTETVVGCSVYEVREGDEEKGGVAIGKPISNTRVYVVDGRMREVGVGVEGELLIGGAGVGRGYQGRAEETAERYVPDWLSGEEGRRLYRTGDVVRWREDGNLEYCGREDEQVKIRGYRIELGEIESVMREQAGVKEAVAAVIEGGERGKRLVGYVVEKAGEGIRIEELRRGIEEKLPEYMVPAEYVKIDEVPLTRNGKVDRRALPAPEQKRLDMEKASVSPRNPTEITLAGIWAQVLGIEMPGVDDNFFDLGGHSLLAMQVIGRVRDAFNVELPLSRLFDAPTIAGLADLVNEIQFEQSNMEAATTAIMPKIGRRSKSFDQQLAELDQLPDSAARSRVADEMPVAGD